MQAYISANTQRPVPCHSRSLSHQPQQASKRQQMQAGVIVTVMHASISASRPGLVAPRHVTDPSITPCVRITPCGSPCGSDLSLDRVQHGLQVLLGVVVSSRRHEAAVAAVGWGEGKSSVQLLDHLQGQTQTHTQCTNFQCQS
jgi:hypothetical protein